MSHAGMMNGAAMTSQANVLRSKHADELRESWQFKILKATKGKNKIGNVALVMLAHSYYEAMDVLLRVAFPGFQRLECPLLTGTAKITPGGQIVCDQYKTPSLMLKNVPLYDCEDDLIKDFRVLADRLKLNDDDRKDLFAAVKRWVSQDRRIALVE